MRTIAKLALMALLGSAAPSIVCGFHTAIAGLVQLAADVWHLMIAATL